jgi:hypothetical protein
MNTKSGKPDWLSFVVSNLAVLGVFAYAWWCIRFDPDLYFSSVQEDEFLEWGTFWAFIFAAVLSVWAAVRQWRSLGEWPWFLVGVGLFCFLVAMEEISWGQRVLTYRPPVYFLEHNFQQELNIHNVFSTGLRKLTLKAVIIGYGILLPLAALWPPLRVILDRIGVISPPAALIPAFVVTFLVYQVYPWKFSGELVELMLGLGFLFTSLEALWRFKTGPNNRLAWIAPLVVSIVVLGLGEINASLSRYQRGDAEELIAIARAETEALSNDFVNIALENNGRIVTRCGLSKRIYSFVQMIRLDTLRERSFSALTQQGMPEERAEFFLDPWNLPYWISDRCEKNGRQTIFVYSFGPNRRRDSSHWEILGDDVGALIYTRPASTNP